VVYALVGYCWLWDKMRKPVFRLPDALMGLMVGWLLIGYSGITSAIPGLGAMANSAHLAGLLSGLALALVVRFRIKTGQED
jgi:GlpG protein